MELIRKYKVYIEAGKKRTFAASIDWPGWARSGRDEESALETLLSYASRYNGVLSNTGLEVAIPAGVGAFEITERLEGNATTDFGAPGVIPANDYVAPDRAELERYETVLLACWQAFDATVAAAEDKELTKGPRGGGRELQEIVDHVRDVEAAYLGNVGNKWMRDARNPVEELRRIRQAVLHTLASAEGAAPPKGPRGGKRWPWRYYVRRAAWHVLDHAWEIEDRAV